MTRTSQKKPRPALDAEGLERLALGYAGRYATTRAKLRSYLMRKLGERGWAESGAPPVERLVARFTELGYVDDRAFASARGAALIRRGYGARRVDDALRAAGIEAEDAEPAKAEARDGGWAAALRFAERKRIGPFAQERADHALRQKAMAAMLRAGHEIEHVRRILNACPGEIPDLDDH